MGTVKPLRDILPLKVSLVAATLAMVAIGLLAQGYAVTTILRHRLIGRIDATLIDAAHGWALEQRGRLPSREGEDPNPGRPPTSFYVRDVDPDGSIWTVVNDQNAEPLLPPDNDVKFLDAMMPTFNPEGMPSMRQDVLAKRLTEVDEFAGVVRQRAKKFGLPTPANDFFYTRIREIEAGYSK